jgi:acetoin utilization deacetylase AcuC-like enzyme
MSRTGLVYHPDYLAHDMGYGHPEAPQRLRAILARLEETGLMPSLVRIDPKPATDDWITQVHTNAYVKTLHARAPKQGHVSLDPDTSMSPGSLSAAYLAVGGVLTAVDAIMDKRVDNAFCAVRPPGHHAEADHAMGFCLINNVDWDVHHGNGTQHAFYDDPTVFFFSTHQYPWYPGTGGADEQGSGKGKGYTLNVPLPAGKGDADYLEVFNRILRPALKAYRPDAVIISAGFDAHRDDPLAGMNLTDQGYRALTKVVKEIAGEHAQGRVLSCLEGGYNLAALAASVEGHLRVLQEA